MESERFCDREIYIPYLSNKYGKYYVSTDGGTVSSLSLKIIESRSSHTFLFRIKFDRKGNAVCKR